MTTTLEPLCLDTLRNVELDLSRLLAKKTEEPEEKPAENLPVDKFAPDYGERWAPGKGDHTPWPRLLKKG